MTYELNFESEPFVTDPEFHEASGLYEAESADWEWEDEANRRRRPRPAPRSAVSRARPRGRIGIPGRRIRSVSRPPIRPPIRPRVRPLRPIIFPTIAWPPAPSGEPRPPHPTAPAGAEPSGSGPAPGAEPSGPPAEGSEHVRWVQDSLNRILALRLPVNGIMGPETRSAIRSFQEQQGLQITGLVGPDTERALIAATNGQSPGVGGTKSAESGMKEPAGPVMPGPAEANATAPASELDFEWETLNMLECEPDLVIVDGFMVGDYRLLPSHYGKLMKLLEKARNSAAAGVPVSLGLTGHTDNSGRERMNTGLSLSRAHEVQTFFMRQGVQVHDVSGEGELRPRFPNTTRANKSRNRRVEILVCVAPSPALRRPSPARQNEYEWEMQEPAAEFDFEWKGTPEPEIDELVGDFEYQPTPWGPTPGTEWPKGRTFKPNAPSIPSGPYTLPPIRKCGVVAHVDQLSIEIQRFEKLIQELRRRRNEPASPQLDEIRSKANRKFNDVTTLINVIIADVKNGTYRRGGCGDRDFAVATCKMRMLGGLWCKSASLKKARCNLVFLLRNSRGTFANVPCTKLGVPLAKDWCKGHTCCCPGVG